MDRRQKQIFYGSIYLVILVAIVFGFYIVFFREKPSCSDGIQNQNEAGIDCGGPCEKLCLAGAQPIKLIGKVNLLYVGLDHASLLAKVENPNTSLAARNFDYVFDIYDEAGKFLRSAGGKSFVYAGEFKYILVPNLEYSVEKISRVDFTSRNPRWVSAEDFFRPKIVIQNHQTEVFGKELRVSGKVINQDLIALPKVKVIAVFFGKFGQTSAASETELDNIGVDEVRPFTVIHPLTEGVNPEATQVFVFAYRP